MSSGSGIVHNLQRAGHPDRFLQHRDSNPPTPTHPPHTHLIICRFGSPRITKAHWTWTSIPQIPLFETVSKFLENAIPWQHQANIHLPSHKDGGGGFPSHMVPHFNCSINHPYQAPSSCLRRVKSRHFITFTQLIPVIYEAAEVTDLGSRDMSVDLVGFSIHPANRQFLYEKLENELYKERMRELGMFSQEKIRYMLTWNAEPMGTNCEGEDSG